MRQNNIKKLVMLGTVIIGVSANLISVYATENDSSTSGLQSDNNVTFNMMSLSEEYHGENWMESIDDELMLSQISIPGTHETCAMYEPVSGVAKCQNLTLLEQFNAGVRYIDIRCRRYDNNFVIHHGSIYQHLNYDDVINTCYDFLKENPYETIIMSVKEEYSAYSSSDDMETIFKRYIKGNEDKWYLTDSIPKLGDVRGRIVLVRRFEADGELGINAYNGWKDNTTFDITGADYSINIEDLYKVKNSEEKWNAINANLNNAYNNSNEKTMYITYTSGYVPLIFNIPQIKKISEPVNEYLSVYFDDKYQTGNYGILAMDYVTEEMCREIIATNKCE